MQEFIHKLLFFDLFWRLLVREIPWIPSLIVHDPQSQAAAGGKNGEAVPESHRREKAGGHNAHRKTKKESRRTRLSSWR